MGDQKLLPRDKIKRAILIFFIIVAFTTNTFSQTETIVTLETSTGNLEGTLLIPSLTKKMPVALIIACSGPTDRNGNNSLMKNNSLKMLADGLNKNGIATLRYDKRGVGESKVAGIKEADLRFENYTEDANHWIDFLKKDKRFKSIIVIGHSEGSLIGMICSQQKNAKVFVSIAGVGRQAANILREQLAAQPSVVLEMSEPILAKLELGETTEDVTPGLYSLFRPSVQPYLISWFKYDLQQEIAQLNKPILIIQGTSDIQVTVIDAEMLAEANPQAVIKIIEGINHIRKESEPDRQKNIETYSNPDLPMATGLIEAITTFIIQ